ncbi:Cell death protease, partial [Tieghemiomyces parasiticus]
STGRAIIQVARTSGQNCILLYPGANHAISAANLEHIMNTFQPRPGELLLLQNEISMMPEALTLGRSHDLTVVWNPAPALTIADDHAQAFDLDAVDLIVVNEDEATVLYEQLRQRESNQQAATGTTQGSKKNRELARNQLTPCLPLDPKTPDDFLAVAERLHQALPDLSGVVITMGAGGVVYHFKSGRKYRTRLEGHYQAPSPASLLGHHCHTRLNNEGNGSAVIDTTGAGDTWVGFFVGYLSQHTPATERGQPIELPPRTLATAVRAASIAAGLSVTKPGAMDSMPNWEEVERLL